MNGSISKWTGECFYGSERASSTVCAFDDFTDMQTLSLLEDAGQDFLTCVHCYYWGYY